MIATALGLLLALGLQAGVPDAPEATAPPDRGAPARVLETLDAWSETLSGGPGADTSGDIFRLDTSKLPTLLTIVAFGLLMFGAQRRAARGEEIPIRRIPGLDAMDEAIGRATEMGRPVLYVPGIDEIKEIQTIYSMMILRHVARKTAEFGTPLLVPVRDSIVMTFAEEAVKGGCMDAGRPDAFIKDNIRYLSNEQFAYCAGVAGIMAREKPAANMMLGMFFAESLILAETGFMSGAIQIAGTAKPHQLPFFVAACDYTIIGEEYFAVTAYLTREPNLLATIRAADLLKVAAVLVFLTGVVLASLHVGPEAADTAGWVDVLKRLLAASGGGGAE